MEDLERADPRPKESWLEQRPALCSLGGCSFMCVGSDGSDSTTKVLKKSYCFKEKKKQTETKKTIKKKEKYKRKRQVFFQNLDQQER